MQDLGKFLNRLSKYYPQGLFREAMQAMQDLEKVSYIVLKKSVREILAQSI